MYKIVEAIKSGVIYYGEQENQFIERVYKDKNIQIKIVDFGFRKDGPLNLSIYVENKNTALKVNKLLINHAMPSMFGHYVHSYHFTQDEPLSIIADEIVDIFLDIYNYCSDDFPSITIYIYRFEKSTVDNISGFAHNELIDMLSKKIPDEKFKMLYRGNSKYYLVLSTEMYNKLNKSFVVKKLIHEMFLITKMHDKFGYVKEEDFSLEIFDKNKVTAEAVGVDPREWLY